MAENIQIQVPVDSVTYTNVQRMELLDFQDLPEWVADGALFLSRADVCSIPGPSGYDAQFANQLPGLTTVARLADTVTGTLTSQAGTSTILGGRPTILASDNTDLRVALSVNNFPTTGPFWVYAAVHALDTQFQIGGNYTSNSLLRLNFTNSEIRLLLTNSVNLIATLPFSANNRDIIVGFGRNAAGYLVIRYKLRGQAWVETVSPSVQSATLVNDFAFMANIPSTNYSPNGYWGAMYFADSDITGGTQANVEAYLTNYYGMQ